jgi:hypothetical protein
VAPGALPRWRPHAPERWALAEAAKLARKVDQLAEVDAVKRGLDAPDGPKKLRSAGGARRSRHLQAVKQPAAVAPARRTI